MTQNVLLAVAGTAFVVLACLRVYLTVRARRRWRVVGRRGKDSFVVREEGRFRELLIVSPEHEQIQSRQDRSRPLSSGAGYVEGLHVGMLVDPRPRRVLFLGGGACIGPRQFEAAYPDARIDVVESEPLVVAAARRFFGLALSERLNVIVDDARRFVSACPAGRYDLVVLDLYDAWRMPAHTATVEFFRLVRAALSEDGAVVANVIVNFGSASSTGLAVLAGLATVFEDRAIAVFDVGGDDNVIVLVAGDIPKGAPQRRSEGWNRGRALTDAMVAGQRWLPLP